MTEVSLDMLESLLRQSDATLLQVADEHPIQSSEFQEAFSTCFPWWEEYCKLKKVSITDKAPASNPTSFTYLIFKNSLKTAVQKESVAARIGEYKVMIYMSTCISTTSKRKRTIEDESDDDDDDEVVAVPSMESTEKIAPAPRVSVDKVVVEDLKNTEDAVGKVKEKAKDVDSFAVDAARHPEFYHAVLSQVNANRDQKQQDWIRVAVTLTNFSREQILSDAIPVEASSQPKPLTEMTERCIFIPWTRMSETVQRDARIRLEGWMLTVINVICWQTLRWNGGASVFDQVSFPDTDRDRRFCTMIKLYMPNAIADIAVQHCNTIFGATLSALNGFCNEHHRLGVRNPRPGNEESKVNKFLSGIATELDKIFSENRTFKTRVVDCFEELQRKTIKASLQVWLNSYSKGLKSSGLSKERRSSEFEQGAKAAKSIHVM